MNKNNNPLWQQAAGFASQKITEITRKKGMLPGEQHAKFIEFRETEYQRLVAIKRVEVAETRRVKTPEEVKSAKEAHSRENALQQRIRDAQREATQGLETIRMTAGTKMLELQKKHETLLPLILCGLADPEEETALLAEIVQLEARTQTATALHDRAKGQAAMNTISGTIGSKALPQPLGMVV